QSRQRLGYAVRPTDKHNRANVARHSGASQQSSNRAIVWVQSPRAMDGEHDKAQGDTAIHHGRIIAVRAPVAPVDSSGSDSRANTFDRHGGCALSARPDHHAE